MLIRFVVHRRDRDSGEPLGIFQAMHFLSDRRQLSANEEARWDELRRWFTANLREPDRLTRSQRPGAPGAAVCWFRDSAAEHIARAREMVAILAEHGVEARMIRTNRPGYVIYEDEFQVAAEPFRGE